MKFLKIISNSSNFAEFEFSQHEARKVNFGDQIWSDGNRVEVYEWANIEAINDLILLVENKTAFRGALRRLDIIN